MTFAEKVLLPHSLALSTIDECPRALCPEKFGDVKKICAHHKRPSTKDVKKLDRFETVGATAEIAERGTAIGADEGAIKKTGTKRSAEVVETFEDTSTDIPDIIASVS